MKHERRSLASSSMNKNDPRNTLSGLVTGALGDLSPGRILGDNYELTEPIGRGGMGQVWKAQDRVGHRTVAIKLLPPELRNHEDAIQQVRESFQKVHALNHQHIGKSLAMLSDASFGPFIVMDLVPGIPLSRYAKQYRQRKGEIPVSHVVKFLSPVAQALDYAHARCVLHRDVKPENILVQIKPYFEVTLIDFGLAATIRSTMTRFTQASTDTRGTRPYMSPEQLRGKSRLWDGRTDQYSLAVVAYELLGGYLPFETEDDFALMYAVLNEPVSSIETCSDLVNQALLKGLEKEKSSRYENCIILVDALASARVSKVPTSVAAPQVSPLPVPQMRQPNPSLPRPIHAATLQEVKKPNSFVNSIGMRLNLIPAGTFMMGSPTSEANREDEETQHRVTLTKPFYLGTAQVTQGQWKSVMRTTPWKGQDYVKEGSNHAATHVSWDDAVEFCKRLSAKESKMYRLPTEAEWEYACRAGTTTAYSFGDDAAHLIEYGWFDMNTYDIGELYAHEAGLKRANGFGLHDMHGNVWEWCSDWYGDYSTGNVTDPQGATEGSYRVHRGGGWIIDARFCRSANRTGFLPVDRDSFRGVRVALSSVVDR
ncbi:MAG TPA: hypothetical protein DDZ51_19170 [Planctomycetaceae bacterium]|nr:hypothetical protein [Planctomycetaceae bacterium]